MKTSSAWLYPSFAAAALMLAAGCGPSPEAPSEAVSEPQDRLEQAASTCTPSCPSGRLCGTPTLMGSLGTMRNSDPYWFIPVNSAQEYFQGTSRHFHLTALNNTTHGEQAGGWPVLRSWFSTDTGCVAPASNDDWSTFIPSSSSIYAIRVSVVVPDSTTSTGYRQAAFCDYASATGNSVSEVPGVTLLHPWNGSGCDDASFATAIARPDARLAILEHSGSEFADAPTNNTAFYYAGRRIYLQAVYCKWDPLVGCTAP